MGKFPSPCLFAPVGGWNKLSTNLPGPCWSHKFDPEVMPSKSASDFSQDSLSLCTAAQAPQELPTCLCEAYWNPWILDCRGVWAISCSSFFAQATWVTFCLANFLSCSGFAFVRLLVQAPRSATGVRNFIAWLVSWLFRPNGEAAVGQTQIEDGASGKEKCLCGWWYCNKTDLLFLTSLGHYFHKTFILL